MSCVARFETFSQELARRCRKTVEKQQKKKKTSKTSRRKLRNDAQEENTVSGGMSPLGSPGKYANAAKWARMLKKKKFDFRKQHCATHTHTHTHWRSADQQRHDHPWKSRRSTDIVEEAANRAGNVRELENLQNRILGKDCKAFYFVNVVWIMYLLECKYGMYWS